MQHWDPYKAFLGGTVSKTCFGWTVSMNKACLGWTVNKAFLGWIVSNLCLGWAVNKALLGWNSRLAVTWYSNTKGRKSNSSDINQNPIFRVNIGGYMSLGSTLGSDYILVLLFPPP